MKRNLWITSFVFLMFFCGCDKPADEPVAFNLPPESIELIKSGNDFGLNLFRGVSDRSQEHENILVSPLSISLALSMTYNGAEGTTQIEMEDAMEMSGLHRTQINELNKQLVEALLAHDPNVLLEIANSIWYRDDFTVKDDFINLNKQYYDAEVSALDFSNPASKDVINGWVADNTHDKIDQIVDQIKPESFMFLINAIYFKGDWRWEFNSKDTYDGEFYVTEEDQVNVPMMNQELDLNTARNELFDAIELPYGKGNWSMFLFLPHHNKSVEDILDELDSKQWDNWMNTFVESKEVDVTIPKFTFEYETSLKDVLIALGMETAFSSSADFSGILEGGGIQVSDVKHKTFIDVNEKGTEAAAVTSVEIELTSVGNNFYANRPFVFVIAEKTSNTILFIGRVINPS